MSPPPKLSRRTLTIGGIAAGAAAVVAGVVYEAPKLFRRRPHGEYADLVGKLGDPEKAAIVGKAIEAQMSRSGAFDSVTTPEQFASSLRKQLLKQSLADVSVNDAKSGVLAEVDGWILPGTVALLCDFAAQSI